ncbi:MAG: hypothetical protein A3K10_13915 [Bacteroidetes bacterium RIFCSPLOWO2_12_FULL_31_6]|nr:MAG: hypothetical protein A3K10_13915 [Bacteroidetes bacterium RIFCSPLOWO2_12_FULL_31_6]
MPIDLHLYPSYLQNESRILKITKSLVDNNITSNIHVVGLWKEKLNEQELIDDKRQILRLKINLHRYLPFLKTFFFRWEWYIKVFFKYINKDVRIIQCNSIEDLPVGVALKIIKKNVKLIYDAHELETEKNTVDGFRKKLLKVVERKLIKHVDAVSVVSKCIVDWYEREYKIPKVYLIRNIPYNHFTSQLGDDRGLKNEKKIRKRFNIGDDEIVFLYQGGLMTGRALLVWLEVFKNLPSKKKHIVYMGYGYFEKEIKQYAEMYQNIHLHPAVHPDVIHEYSVDANVGLSIFENIYMSYYFCLPNKLYEYTLCNVPVLVSDFPEMSRAIFELKSGWIINPTYEEMYKFVDEITLEEVNQKKALCNINKDKIGWHTEEKILLEMYKSLDIK